MGLRDLFKRKAKKAKKKNMKVAKKKSIKKAPRPKKKVVRKTAKKSVKRKITKPAEINRNECPECGSGNVVISKVTGNTICQDCGAIFAGLMPEVEQKIEEVKNQS